MENHSTPVLTQIPRLSAELIGDLEVTINDALFTSMQNYSDRISSDGTEWSECKHGLDGTRVYECQSYNPTLSRFKSIAHIKATPSQCREAFMNWAIRPGWDASLYRANLLKELDLPYTSGFTGGKLQLLYYSTNKFAGGACAGRDFFEVRVLLPPQKDSDTGKVITHQIREDKVEKYKVHVHSRDNKLAARHHEGAVFFKPFNNGKMTQVTMISKIELSGSIFRGSLSKMSEHVWKVASDLKLGLETEGKLYLPEYEQAQAEAEITVGAIRQEALKLTRTLTLSNSVLGFDSEIIKGPPGIGYGLVIEEVSGLVTVKHTIKSSIKYKDMLVNGKVINRAHDIEVGDIIVEVEGEPVAGNLDVVVQVLKMCKIGDGVKLGFERLDILDKN